MAEFTSFQGVTFQTLDFRFYGWYFLEEGYQEDAFIEFDGVVYDDVYYVRGWDGERDTALFLLGTDYGTDADNWITQGTVEAIIESDWTGNDLWAITGTSLDLMSVFDGLYSGDETAEADILAQALAGDDVFMFHENSEGYYHSVLGYGGNDVFQATGDGLDRLYGGSGDNYFMASAGDEIYGGEDFDTLDMSLLPLPADLTLGKYASLELSNAIRFYDIEAIIGTALDDVIMSDLFTSCSLSGGEGDDTLQGGRNSDTVIGGSGADSISGNFGHDLLIGDDVDLEALAAEYDFLVF